MINNETFLWTHEPLLSEEPIERLFHSLIENDKLINEAAIFKLKNEKYLFIHFCGNKEDLSLGFTELIEFEDEEKARVYLAENFTIIHCSAEENYVS